MMDKRDEDYKLKQKMMRYFWRLGYFVRSNVKLTRETELGVLDLTDIDVLALKFSSNFQTEFIICDCKSGKNVSNSERLLWLSGLKNYFDSNTAYFVRGNIDAKGYEGILDKLKIYCMTKDHLTWLESIYDIDSQDFYGPFIDNQEQATIVFREIARKTDYSLDYLFIDYWSNEPQHQILQLMSICMLMTQSSNINENEKQFVLLYCYGLLSLAILRFCSKLLMLPTSNKEEYIQETLLSGKIPYKERVALVEDFYSFMVKEIEKRYKKKYPISKSEFVAELIPRYKPYIVDYLLRLVKYPESAFFIPRFFDMMFYNGLIGKQNIPFFRLFEGFYKDDLSLKPLKDFRVFAERSKIISEKLNSSLKKQIGEFEAYLNANNK